MNLSCSRDWQWHGDLRDELGQGGRDWIGWAWLRGCVLGLLPPPSPAHRRRRRVFYTKEKKRYCCEYMVISLGLVVVAEGQMCNYYFLSGVIKEFS